MQEKLDNSEIDLILMLEEILKSNGFNIIRSLRKNNICYFMADNEEILFKSHN